MNWTSGFLRLWAALAACWVCLQTLFMWDRITAKWIWDPIVSADGSIHASTTPFKIAAWIMLPPLLLLLLGFAVAWIARGFRSSAPPEGS
jgi:hypothetical protein